MTSVIEYSAVGAYHPIIYILTIDAERRARFTVGKCCDHGCWANQRVPRLEKLLPGDNGLVAPVECLQVAWKSGRLSPPFLLEGSNHHTYLLSGAWQFLMGLPF